MKSRPVLTKVLWSLIAWLMFVTLGYSQSSYVAFTQSKGAFPLSAHGKSAPLYTDPADYPGVLRALKDFQSDVAKVSNATPKLSMEKNATEREVVIVGTIGKSAWIDQLIKAKKINTADLAGKWESFLVQVVDKPLPNIDRALVIAGSDKRGTIYGIYDVSKNMGVSPWYWWADVPPKKSNSLYVLPGRFKQGEPGVKYRGIFLNDEEPALGRWAVEKYGGFNHQFYEKVFELILRMKGNYLWPAMWWASFNSDDPLNPRLADEYGIVIGTTHHEPLMRAHAEWRKAAGGEWNYETNTAKLQKFWTEGIQRMGSNESIVSLGMRGDGDMAMTAETNIALLEKIVADQRKIIGEVTGKEASSTPQLWALYKEVQDYYDKGMRVPDDVTLLLCDDNWGNIRKVPKLEDKPRAGGYGIYYHFDYVGGPRNYKWLNTNQISRVWEQMNLAYQSGVNRIWIVNVGDLKPMEFPIEFFLDHAWNPDKINSTTVRSYSEEWASRQFGKQYAKEIGDILVQYTRYNSRRKPELLAADTYSLVNYAEAERIVSDYDKLSSAAERIYQALSAELKDSFYQLVLFPVQASANLHELWVTVGKNRLYAKQGRASTNELAKEAAILFARDSSLALSYNKTLAGGKWNHMMDQTHISYTYWQQPPKDVLPAVENLEIPEAAGMGVAIEGSESAWPGEKAELVLPPFDAFNKPARYLEIFNRGKSPFDYTITSEKPWALANPASGRIENQQRVTISIDWSKVPPGTHRVPVTISGTDGSKVVVQAVVSNLSAGVPNSFLESDGYVSIEAEHYAAAVSSKAAGWVTIPQLGRTLSGVTSTPVTAPSQQPGAGSPHLEYSLRLVGTGEVKVNALISPTLNFHNTEGLRYAISFDDQEPQVVNIHDDKSLKAWENWVSDNIIIKTTSHTLTKAGEHTLKFWMVDAGVVLQKLVVATGPVRPSYLGPPESYHNTKTK